MRNHFKCGAVSLADYVMAAFVWLSIITLDALLDMSSYPQG